MHRHFKSKAVKYHSDMLMEAHKNMRNQINQLNRHLKREYFRKAINKAEGTIKNAWQVINKLIHRRSKTTNIPYIEIDGKTVTEPREKVKELNSYFSRVGENLSKKFNENVTSETQHSNTVTSKVTSKWFLFRKVTEELIVWAIMQIKTKTSCGPDNISSFILKIACPVVSKSLVKIFNTSLETGIFSEVWKLERGALNFKTGVKSDMSNYWPISVLSTVARVFEKIVYEQLYDYFEKNRFLTKYQSGFRRLHSIVTAMLKNTNDWLLNMDKGHYNGVILFDLKKAFDTVDHGILTEKLKNYGIQNTELGWFGSYLLLLFKWGIIGNSRGSLWYTPGIVSGTTAVSDIYQWLATDPQKCRAFYFRRWHKFYC